MKDSIVSRRFYYLECSTVSSSKELKVTSPETITPSPKLSFILKGIERYAVDITTRTDPIVSSSKELKVVYRDGGNVVLHQYVSSSKELKGV